jgi:hypothetical protein
MESLEIIVYMMVAILAGGMIVLAVKTTDFHDVWRSFTRTFHDDEELYKVGLDGVAKEVSNRWESCRYGLDNKSSSVYVKDAGNVTREFLVQELLKADRCDQIDCRNISNGLLVAPNITTPKILNIQCFNETLIIS